MSKHYDSKYLENSARLTQSIKEYSYEFFKEITNGNIIDLGCGNGIDVHEMAQCLDSTNMITGIDHDNQMINIAKSRELTSNVNFICSEARDIPFQDSAINGIRTERVFQHLLNPQDVVKEVYRVLREGSPFVLLETDWQGFTLYTELLDIEHKIQRYLVEKKVNNGLASRRISTYLNNQGFKNIRARIFPIRLYSLEETNKLLKIEEIIKEMESQKEISSKDASICINLLKDRDIAGSFMCSINLIVFSCEK